MEVVSYQCPHCGAPIAFDADQHTFHCDFCGQDASKEELIKREGEAIDADKLKQYHCPSCGADLVTDENTAATFCRFCGSPGIVRQNLEGVFKPDQVIPFHVSKDKAQALFAKWCHRGRFAPRGFFSKQQLEKITGTYVPFWLFDCDVNSTISGTAKKIRTWRSGDREYTNTKNFFVMRSGEFSFRGVPADGSSRMDDDLMDALEPYQYEEMVPFDLPYLSGFAAEKYDIPAKEVFKRVDKRMDEAAESTLRQSISGYSSQVITGKQKHYRLAKSRYVLMPVWMLRYHYQNQDYIFAVNGQTGKVVGKPPVSKGKVMAYMGALTAGLFAVLTLGGALLL